MWWKNTYTLEAWKYRFQWCFVKHKYINIKYKESKTLLKITIQVRQQNYNYCYIILYYYKTMHLTYWKNKTWGSTFTSNILAPDHLRDNSQMHTFSTRSSLVRYVPEETLANLSSFTYLSNTLFLPIAHCNALLFSNLFWIRYILNHSFINDMKILITGVKLSRKEKGIFPFKILIIGFWKWLQ